MSRMNRRLLVATAVVGCALALGACNRPQSGAANSAGAAGAQPAGVAGHAPRPSAETAQQAVDFLISRLDKVDTSRGDAKGSPFASWTPHDVVLNAQGWKWGEDSTDLVSDDSGVAATSVWETYAVSPALLSYPAAVKEIKNGNTTYWSVTMECTSSDCLHVVGRKEIITSMVFDKEPETTTEQINENREQNSWYFRDEDAARRAARALDLLIQYQGGKEKLF